MGEYDDMFYDPPTPRKQVRLEARIEALEAKLLEAKAALEKIASYGADRHWEGVDVAKQALRTLGETG